MVSASQQLIDVGGIGARSRVLSQDRQVGSHLAVEQRQFLKFSARKLAETARVGLVQEGFEAVPVGPSLANPEVGEDLRHGPEFRSA